MLNRHWLLITGYLLCLLVAGCDSDSIQSSTTVAIPASNKNAPLLGEYISRTSFTNPYAHIPAQCYIETAGGSQNACLFCHSNGLFLQGLGNNAPQAGYDPLVGNLQLEYAFAALNYPQALNGSVMPWENTLFPEKLRAALQKKSIDPARWDMQAYIREDNWSKAYSQRPGSPLHWDAGVEHPWRLFPGLDPADLPADSDGFVRSQKSANGFFHDGSGYITGWRAVNFMPYGIFTPQAGSVSGIYLRLPPAFMQTAAGVFDLATYHANLALLARAIQDRLQTGDKHYQGAAAAIAVERGLYPLGTEFAHPLHYVDVAADGTDRTISPFPGTRARRVKEIRYLYKHEVFVPNTAPQKDEDAPVYAHRTQGWIDNSAGWYLSAYIEAEDGQLRPQTASELVQCVGCHSGNVYRKNRPTFTSGTGNTIDSTWALPRQWQDASGWAEMDYLGYRANRQASSTATPGNATRLGDPINRGHQQGEFKFFLNHVVGASLYGDMPMAMEAFLATRIQTAHGYSANWPALDPHSAETLYASQRQRLRLIRELTAKGDYLDASGSIQAALLYPPQAASLASAARYRQVVVTQRQ